MKTVQTPQEFFEIVKQTRQAQKNFYAWKGDKETKKNLLVKARNLENQLDQMILAIQQPGLF